MTLFFVKFQMTIILPYLFKKWQEGTLKDSLELIGQINKLKCYECYIHHCVQEK